MKVTIEFNLPEEQSEYETCMNASKYSTLCWELEQEMRKIWKYEAQTDEVLKIIERLRDFYYETKADLFEGE